MQNYCSNCGNPINQNQDVCLNCGKNLKKSIASLNLYIKSSGIITIILGAIIDISAEYIGMQEIGFTTIISGILVLCSKKSKTLSIISGILLILAALGLIRLYEIITIASMILLGFGIFNIVLSER